MGTRVLEEKVDRAIRRQKLIAPEESIVVAVSGGPDSVALLMCLEALQRQWSWKLSVAHVNHGLRGEESEGDMAFVEKLAGSLRIPFQGVRLHLDPHEKQFQKESRQEVVRNLRYQALQRMILNEQATKLALGHTQDDQAETVLMWMLRGSGSGGMGGIPPQRGDLVTRPFLDISRSEILSYLEERQIEYRMDSSNAQPLYLRNRIRQELIPRLQSFSPGINKILSRQAQLIRDDHAYLDALATDHFQAMTETSYPGVIELNKRTLLALPIALARRMIRMGLQQLSGNARGPRFDFVQRVHDRLTHGQSGWSLFMHGVEVTQEYDRLVFRINSRDHQGEGLDALESLPLSVPSEMVWPLTNERLSVWWANDQVIKSPLLPKSQMFCDANTFTPELRWRRWQSGDVFCPKGMGGKKKKLQDFFSDMKLPRSLRKTIPLLVAPEGIVWVAGLREDERFQVSSETTSVIGARIYDPFDTMVKA